MNDRRAGETVVMSVQKKLRLNAVRRASSASSNMQRMSGGKYVLLSTSLRETWSCINYSEALHSQETRAPPPRPSSTLR